MFHEHRDLIAQLRVSNRHFMNLFDQHNTLDQQIKNMEARVEVATHEEIEKLKKIKLALKDQIYGILKNSLAQA